MRLELGRFLELSLATADIAASVLFYERLGFGQLITGDAWRHRYGVVSDGHIHLGLHEDPTLPTLAVSYVLPDLRRAQARLQAHDLSAERALLGDAELHRLRLRDPGGHALLLLEARTFSPTPLSYAGESLCGYFMHLSLPQPDFQAARRFWEAGGLIALSAERQPYPHLPLTGDQLSLAFHPTHFHAAPLLVFAAANLHATETRLAELDMPRHRLPDLSEGAGLLIKAPEGTGLLLVPAAD